jgi:GntR family transcriptional regulator
MLHFQIDLHSGVPVYRQLMDQIRYYVASGALRAEDQLPSIRELARVLAVNPATVVKAYTELEHEGIIEARQGRGAFVSAKGPIMPAGQRRERLRVLATQLAVEARQMGAGETEAVAAVQQAFRQLSSSPNETSKSSDKSS